MPTPAQEPEPEPVWGRWQGRGLDSYFKEKETFGSGPVTSVKLDLIHFLQGEYGKKGIFWIRNIEVKSF